MKWSRKNQRGVALMLVLSAITILTTMVVEFAYNTSVHYNLALNERDRLQAYYLARSGYNFMLLELKFDKTFRRIVESQNLGQYLGSNAQLPLCQQFPLSTGLIRTVFTGGGLEGMMGGEGGGEEGEVQDAEAEGGEESDAEEQIEDMQRDVSVSQEKDAQEFLQFEGDFDGECVDEGTKINLNGFAGLSKTPAADGKPSPFDDYKRYFFRFLSKPEFELLFKESDLVVTDVIDNMADWIDSDVELDQFDGRKGGAERSLYDRLGVGYAVRNGKLITLLEAYLIDGVTDTWFAPLEDYFTIYGDAKVNVCTASTDIIQSLIYRYIDSTPGLPPVRLEDPEEMDRLVNAIMDGCSMAGTGDQQVQNVVNSLNAAIGTEEEEQGEEGQPQQQDPNSNFASYITSGSRYFTLKLAGQAMDTTVRIKTVIDVKEDDPKKWKLLYWRIY